MFARARDKLRVFNAFLQGHFRHSSLTYGEGDVHKRLAEVRVGVEWRASSGWTLQYLARWESPELRGIGLALFHLAQHRGLEIVWMKCQTSWLAIANG